MINIVSKYSKRLWINFSINKLLKLIQFSCNLMTYKYKVIKILKYKIKYVKYKKMEYLFKNINSLMR